MALYPKNKSSDKSINKNNKKDGDNMACKKKATKKKPK